MIDFKSDNGKILFGLTILSIIMFVIFIFLFLYLKKKDNKKFETILFLYIVFLLILNFLLTYFNNDSRLKDTFTDSNKINIAFSIIPISIAFIIGLIFVYLLKKDPKPV